MCRFRQETDRQTPLPQASRYNLEEISCAQEFELCLPGHSKLLRTSAHDLGPLERSRPIEPES